MRATAAVSALTKRYDVVIVGASPIGALCALRMPSHVSVAMVDASAVDKAPAVGDIPDLRTFAITPASAALLDDVGVWSGIEATPSPASQATPRIAPFTEMQVWDNVGVGHVRFSGSGDGRPLGHIVEAALLQSAVNDAVAAADNIDTYYSTPVTGVQLPSSLADAASGDSSAQAGHSGTIDTHLHVTVDGEAVTLATPLLVGADGGNSVVRRMSGLGTWGWSYDSRAVVATVTSDVPHSTAWQRFLPHGPLAVLPLWGNHSSIIWSTSVEHAQQLQSMAEQEFVVAVNTALRSDAMRAAPDHASSLPLFLRPLAAVTESATTVARALTARHAPFWYPPEAVGVVGKRASFPLALSHANNYVKPGVALIGDAAHTTHPLAGQGMNLGFADAAELADAVRRCQSSGGSPSAQLTALRQYEASRRIQNVAMINSLDVLKRVFAAPDSSVLGLLRDMGLSGLNAVDPIKHMVMKYAMGDYARAI